MIISEQIFEDNVDLISSDLNKDIANIILIKLQRKYEGLCRDNSFILKNSINISKRSMGKVETYDNINYIKYVVSYKCDTISLKMGDIIEPDYAQNCVCGQRIVENCYVDLKFTDFQTFRKRVQSKKREKTKTK